MMLIKLAESASEIKKCYSVFSQLHSHLLEKDFIALVQEQQENGYKLVFLEVDDAVKSVAGFHLGNSFGWRTYLYVDDFVTDEASQSKGYGAKLFSWLVEYGKQNSCNQVHLDSRVTRYSAHKFYLNQGMIIGGYHFLMNLT